jgi:hypothetical protein
VFIKQVFYCLGHTSSPMGLQMWATATGLGHSFLLAPITSCLMILPSTNTLICTCCQTDTKAQASSLSHCTPASKVSYSRWQQIHFLNTHSQK